MNCGLLVLLGSTSRDSLGLLQLLGAVLLRSELLRLLVELGSGLRLLLWVLGIEFARAVEYEIDDVPAVGIAGDIRSTWCIGLAMILGRDAAHETVAADNLGPQLWRRKGVPGGVVE